MRTETKVEPYFQRVVVRKPIGGLQWATGEISGANLLKLAGLSGVISVVSFQSYAPVPAPNDDFRGGIGYQPSSLKLEKGKGAQVKEALRKLTAGMSPEQVREKLRTDPAFRAKVSEILGRPLPQRPALPEKPSLPPQGGIQPATIKVKDVHGASAAWTKGYTGTGVVAAVVDTGVDFAHPDLQGTQARVPSGPYAGWPYSYDTLSGLFYAFGYPT
jgi:subtilisin family serine protease